MLNFKKFIFLNLKIIFLALHYKDNFSGLKFWNEIYNNSCFMRKMDIQPKGRKKRQVWTCNIIKRHVLYIK